jgi:hypothetical protein
MSELNVMWLDRSSCGLSVYAWLFGVGCLLCLLLCGVGLGAVFLLFVSRASRYGFGIFGCWVDSCRTRNFCSGCALLGSLSGRVCCILASVVFLFAAMCVVSLSCVLLLLSVGDGCGAGVLV